MKNIILFICLITSINLYTQSTLGIQAGFNRSTFIQPNGGSQEFSPLFGGNLTLIYSKNIIDKFNLEVGIGVISKGAVYKSLIAFPTVNSQINFDRKVRLYYSHLPIKVSYYTNKKKPSLFLSLGTYLEFGLQSDIFDSGILNQGSNSSNYYSQSTGEWNQMYEQFDAGITLEFGAFLKIVKIGFQYQHGFSDIVFSPNNDKETIQNSLFQLNIEYLFKLKDKASFKKIVLSCPKKG